jgi:hypothetical protein
VVTAACQTSELTEIIIVDDGSSDATAAEARQAAAGDPRLRVLKHPTNRGKGEAVFTGWRATRAPFLVLLDADLIHLQPDHIRELIRPVLARQADMTIGVFHQGGQWRADAAHRLTPWLSGQRGLRASLLRQLSPAAAAGYGLETALTVVAQREAWRQVKVPLPGVTHPLGEIPRGGWHGPLSKVQMFAHVVRAWWRLHPWRARLTQVGEHWPLFGLFLLTLTLSIGQLAQTIGPLNELSLMERVQVSLLLSLGLRVSAVVEWLHWVLPTLQTAL